MWIHYERKLKGRARRGLITRAELRGFSCKKLPSVCDEVEAVFISREGKGVKQRRELEWCTNAVRRDWEGRLGSEWLLDGEMDEQITWNGYVQKALPAERWRESDFCITPTPQTELIPLSLLSILTSSLSLSLWEFCDPVCSSTRQQQSYFYVLTGDNTLSSARPRLICMLPSARPSPPPS